MKDNKEEVLPERFLKKYQKSPRIYSQDNEFLGHDLAYSKAYASRILITGFVVTSIVSVDTMVYEDDVTYGSLIGVISANFLLQFLDSIRQIQNVKEILVRR